MEEQAQTSRITEETPLDTERTLLAKEWGFAFTMRDYFGLEAHTEGYFFSSLDSERNPLIRVTRLVNSMGKMNFVEGLAPRAFKASRY